MVTVEDHYFEGMETSHKEMVGLVYVSLYPLLLQEVSVKVWQLPWPKTVGSKSTVWP